MKKKKIIYTVAVLFLIAGGLNAQIDPETRTWVRSGSLQSFFSAWGAERAWNANLSIYEGLQWPAWYSRSDNFVIDRAWMVCRDFTNEAGEQMPYKAMAFISTFDPNYAYPLSITQSAKYEESPIYVDGIPKVTRSYADTEHSLDLPYDRLVTNVVNTSLGITVTRKVYHFSQQYHDNYFIVEYTYENTGNTDADDEIELTSNTIKDLMIGAMPRYATSREAGFAADSRMVWGMNQWVAFTGNDYASGADSIRAFWSWHGQSDIILHDAIGAPYFPTDKGRLTGSAFAGMAFLYTGTDPSDPSTDMKDQPSFIGWHGGDTYPSVYNNDPAGSEDLWNMLNGTIEGPLAGYKTAMCPVENPNKAYFPQDVPGNDGGGAAGFYAYGPFDLAPGEKIVIVQAEGISGLNRDKNIEVGGNWYAHYLDGDSNIPLIGPDGTELDNKDNYKNAWVYTGRDSILKTLSRARKNFESGFAIPQPPRPPEKLFVDGEGDRIHVYWDPSPDETNSDFGGYAIYRAVSRVDSIYRFIWACGPGTDNPTIVNEYNDMTPQRGMAYYYYVVSRTDGTANTGALNPPGPLVSNRVFSQTSQPAYLKRKAEQVLDMIRVVPNPYNIKSRERQYGLDDGKDQIMFLNLPKYCKINIYTERGDLVEAIVHDDGSGDEAWNLITSDRQIVVSGIYIAYIEVTQDVTDEYDDNLVVLRAGDSIIKKFVVIR